MPLSSRKTNHSKKNSEQIYITKEKQDITPEIIKDYIQQEKFYFLY